MLGYTDKTQIEKYIGTDINSSYNTQVKTWIGQMEEYINRFTGRVFIADTTESEKWFDGAGGQEMFIDEAIEIVGTVKIYDTNGSEYYTLTEDTDFVAYPYNEKPIRKMIMKSSIAKYFLVGIKNVSVTAKWGYSVEVPAEIAFSTTVFVAGIINFSNNKTPSKMKSEKLGDYSISFRDEKGEKDFGRAIEIINSYKKPNV